MSSGYGILDTSDFVFRYSCRFVDNFVLLILKTHCPMSQCRLCDCSSVWRQWWQRWQAKTTNTFRMWMYCVCVCLRIPHQWTNQMRKPKRFRRLWQFNWTDFADFEPLRLWTNRYVPFPLTWKADNVDNRRWLLTKIRK